MQTPLDWIATVARCLGDIREEVAFLGGATITLLITDPASPVVRPTRDVDLIVEVGSWAAYAPLQQRLRARGFKEDTEEGAPLCRWVVEDIKVDVMPTEGAVLGFTNRWYSPAIKAAKPVTLAGMTIRLVTAPYFVATKLEAFKGRGDGDYALSHDIEDVVAVFDGRSELVGEVEVAEQTLKRYLADELAELLSDEAFRDALPGHLPGDRASQARLPKVLAAMQRLANV